MLSRGEGRGVGFSSDGAALVVIRVWHSRRFALYPAMDKGRFLVLKGASDTGALGQGQDQGQGHWVRCINWSQDIHSSIQFYAFR